jgi:hypothetical protein
MYASRALVQAWSSVREVTMKRLRAAWIAFALLSVPAGAQDTGQDHTMNMNHAQAIAQGAPTEGGQSAFAAIQEIVAKLETDPKTDWSKVNIEALRQHLIDMDNVTLRSIVTENDVENGAQFLVTSVDQAVVASIRRMTAAHVSAMNGVNGLAMSAQEIEGGASLAVIGDTARIRALGYIGIMTVGMHHQSHHWMLATGADPHRE